MGNITQFWGRQFPLDQVGFLLRYFAFALAFEEQGLVQLVIAPPAGSLACFGRSSEVDPQV